MRPGRIILFTLLVAVSVVSGFIYLNATYEKLLLEGKRDLSLSVRETGTDTTYVLQEENWTTYPVRTVGERFKVISNATVPSQLQVNPGQVWYYSFQVQILDKDGEILYDKEHYQKTMLTKFEDKQVGDKKTNIFYLDTSILPMDTRSFKLDIAPIKSQAEIIRFKLVSKSDDILDVGLRLYLYEKRSLMKQEDIWLTMNEKRRAKMARGNVYPPDFLTKEERTNLISYRWRAVGPIGVIGKNFVERTLYIYRDLDTIGTAELSHPMGLYIRKGHIGAIPLPLSTKRVRLEFEPMNEVNTEEEDAITVTWSRRSSGKRIIRKIKWDESETFLEEDFEPGLLIVESKNTLVVRAYSIMKRGEYDITPMAMYSKNYVLEGDGAIEYEIEHQEGTPTPFKILFRFFDGETDEPSEQFSVPISYSFYGANGDLLKEEELLLESPVSRFDQIVDGIHYRNVSENVTRFFNLPENVRKIRFTTQKRALIAGYTRPQTLMRSVRVPLDYQPAKERDPHKQPGWYGIRPVDYERLFLEGKTMRVSIQQRPSTSSLPIMRGEFISESFRPNGRNVYRRLLAPKSIESNQPKPSVFYAIKPNTNHRIRVQNSKNPKRNVWKLFYMKDSSKQLDIKVLIDGKPFENITVFGKRGTIKIPDLPSGSHSLRLRINSRNLSSGDAFYLDNILTNSASYVRKEVVPFRRSIQYTYRKKTHGREVVSLRLYTPYGDTKVRVLTTTISGVKKRTDRSYKDWTFDKRKFVITPSENNPIQVLERGNEQTNEGELMFIVFGSDLPPGDYKLNVRLLKGAGGYIQLYKLTLGVFDEVNFATN